jgi:eukaryotic-like serine/threonine-protein kinase
MATPDRMVSASLLKFGDDVELDLGAYELRKAGQPLRLGRIPMELLLLLVGQRGQLVTRERIIERVWGKDVFLDTDNSINAAIRKIRQVLEDDPEEPRFVQTVIGRGYRFIASIEEAGSSQPPESTMELQIPQGLVGRKVSHYRILHLLGGGGMGLVYLAEDLKLGRRVAIKFLPEELADDPVALARVEKEARAASGLDHPNICAVYELGEDAGRPFIVMQFLEGRTLRQWIEEAAALSATARQSQLLNFAIQIAEGLAAAHRRSTVHRDIKPANIFVTSQNQIKILDFGVAQLTSSPEIGTTATGEESDDAGFVNDAKAVHITSSDASIGTPSYLSPEQIRREPLDARTDLFSFGLVLYEMVTGRRAFAGSTATAIRNSVLQNAAIPPKQLDPGITPDLEKIIDRCLEKDRGARYQSAEELRRDLAAIAAPGSEPLRQRPNRAAIALICGALLTLPVLFGLNVFRIREKLFRNGTPDAAISAKARPSVAVLGFKNLSGKEDETWISTALSEMLGAEMASGQKLHLIAGESVARMQVDLALPAADSYSADTLTKIRKDLGSDMVLLGSYLALGQSGNGKVRINLQLQDARTGETITVISEDGNEADLAELVSRSGDRLREVLRIGAVSATAADQVRGAIPENPAAARFYAEGLVKLRSFDALAARDLFIKAIAADPHHAPSHAALSECWSALGYDHNAEQEAKKAVELSSKLSREDQLAVEGRYRSVSHEWPRALEVYRMLWGFFPDNLDYGLDLARVQAAAGMGNDALATVSALSKASPAAADARIDIVEAAAADKVGDLRREESASARAVGKGQQQGARILTANALLIQGSALSALGDNSKAVATIKQAQEIFSAVGDRQGVARALNDLGIIERHQSDVPAAQKHLEESLEISRQTGSKLGMVQSSNNLGNILWDLGDLKGALNAYEQSLQLSRETGDKSHESAALNNVAGLLTLQGKLAEARQSFDESLRLSQELGDREGVGTAQGNIADLLTRQGDLPAARKMADEALATDRQAGVKSVEGYALYQLGAVLVLQGDLASGRARLQESVDVRHELGERVTEAESQIALAQVQVDSGDARNAEPRLRSTLPVFHEGGSTDDEALNYALLASALLAQRKSTEAQHAAQKSAELLPRVMDQAIRLQAESNNAYVSAGGYLPAAPAQTDVGKTQHAIRELEAISDKAKALGYTGLGFEAQLRLAELELQSGRAREGRTRLEQLQKDALSKGFVFNAGLAADALRADSLRR